MITPERESRACGSGGVCVSWGCQWGVCVWGGGEHEQRVSSRATRMRSLRLKGTGFVGRYWGRGGESDIAVSGFWRGGEGEGGGEWEFVFYIPARVQWGNAF